MIDTTTHQAVRGWNQRIIAATRVALVGTGPITQLALLYLTAAEFGAVRVFSEDTPEPYQHDVFITGDRDRPMALEQRMHNAFANTTITGIPTWFSPALAGDPTVVVDTTNDPYSKYVVAEFCARRHLPFISASSSNTLANVVSITPRNWASGNYDPAVYHPHLHDEYKGRPQGNITSLMAAGLTVEAIRKQVCPLFAGEEELHHGFVFNLRSADFQGTESSVSYNPDFDFRQHHALVVGAGALGNSLCVGLSRLGFGTVDIMDYKKVHPTNLCRQPLFLFANSIGTDKATTLSDVCNTFLNPHTAEHRTAFTGIIGKAVPVMTPAEKKLGYRALSGETAQQYDLICSAVDNNDTRLYLDELARRHNIPLVDGALGDTGGTARISHSTTPTLAAQGVDITSAPTAEEIGCAAPRHTPAIGYLSPITAAMMLSLATRALQLIHPIRTPLVYDLHDPNPISLQTVEVEL